MDNFINETAEEKKVYFQQASVDLGLPIQIIEKDFWVCWTLKTLFQLETINDNLTFKGGTSLSKVYDLIRRFSEDIDISVDKEFLGFKGDRNPTKATSNKKAKDLIKELGESCQIFVDQNLRVELLSVFKNDLSNVKEEWSLEIDPDDKDKQTILFFYPRCDIPISEYVRPAVKIEVGARADHWPVSMRKITPYVVESIPQGFETKYFEIRVLNAERTFWEKATILHMYANYPVEKQAPERQSRHYYDFYCLINSDVFKNAVDDIDLLGKVTAHKSLYFRSGWADYENAIKGSLKIIPSGKVLSVMEKDYKAMNEMFFGEIPAWEEIIIVLSKFEKNFNK
jgi:hypothetical protein